MNIAIKKLFFYQMHPEAALRYLPIVDLIKKLKLQKSKILEVGSGAYGITPYLKTKITGVDFDFSEGESKYLKRVNGVATDLPFRRDAFDVVILSDVLEHIPEKFRSKSLFEAVRVSKKYIIISGPFGEMAAVQDRKLAEYSIKKIGSMHPFFKDHLDYGLPDLADIDKYLVDKNKVKSVKIIGEFLNLKVRERLMKYFITKNRLQFYFYLKGLMVIVPFLKRLNKKPCYRTLILVTLR